MTVQSKKREKVGWRQSESWFNNTPISLRRAEMMFELVIQNEIEKKRCKLLNDVCMRKLEFQKLRRKMHFSPENLRDSLPMELHRMAGQPTNVQTAQATRLEPTREKECSWRRTRRYDSSAGGVNDDVWSHLRMTGGILDLPKSPELGSTIGTWSKSVESIGLRANCNNEEFTMGLMELCNLSDTVSSGEVQSASLPRGMTVPRGSQVNAQPSSSKDENTFQDQKFNVDLFKTEICKSWKKFGTCIYGKTCHFAHGIDELRLRPKPHRNYKTEMCKKFLAGFCPYGSRCCFVHNPKEQYQAITGGHFMEHSKENRDMIRRWHR